LPATILLNSLICENYPEIVERIKLRDDDVCSHGRTNAEALGGLWEHDEATIIAEVTETITKHFGVRPTGWMGPGAAESRVTIDLIKEAGYTHNYWTRPCTLRWSTISCCLSAAFSASSWLLGLKSEATRFKREHYQRGHRGRN
jgi:peptidoglycan/xylan/chitin deacetylase (PgdA/CDA1 family)